MKKLLILIALIMVIATGLLYFNKEALGFKPDINQLLEDVESKDADKRAAAILALPEYEDSFSKTIPLLGRLTLSQKDTDVIAAEMAIKKIGPAILDHLGPLLDSDDPIEINAGCNALACIGEAAAPRVDYLVGLLKKGDESLAFCACKGLEKMGPAAAPALEECIKLLDSPSFNLQMRSTNVLAAIGPKAEPAIDKLLEVATDGNPSASSNAAIALGSIGTEVDDPRIIEVLSAKLDAFHVVQRERSLIGLAMLGEKAKPALPKIEALMTDESKSIMPEAAYTYVQISGDMEKAIPVLKRACKSATYQIRALEKIILLGSRGEPFVDEINELLKQDDPATLEVALLAAQAIGPGAQPLNDALKALSQNAEDEVLKQMARDAFDAINVKDE